MIENDRKGPYRSTERETEDRDDLALELPFTGPRFLNPVIWRRRLLTARGQAALWLVLATFLSGSEYHSVATRGFYHPMTIRVVCAAIPASVLFLFTNISPFTPYVPR
jgi:hypothetical protein